MAGNCFSNDYNSIHVHSCSKSSSLFHFNTCLYSNTFISNRNFLRIVADADVEVIWMDEYMKEMNEEEDEQEKKSKFKEFLRAIFLIPDKKKKQKKIDNVA